MEQEVSGVVKLGIALIAMAALINIVWYTVKLGGDIKLGAFNEGVEIASAVENSTLASLRCTESTVMPKASAYALLEQSSSGISKMVYNGRNITYSGNKWVDDVDFDEHDSVAGFLAEDITGKVRLKVAHDNIGTYVVTIDTVNVT